MQDHSAIIRPGRYREMLVSLTMILFSFAINAQLSYKVLFLGNSYTSLNNLPQLVHDVALSAGDTLIFDSNAPGSYQLIDHSTDVTSQNKIVAGGWNYVVIQGQSQEPITFSNQFTNGGSALYNQIRLHNPCAVVMPYMTWGRKNGDPSNCATYPVMCTYQGMDTTLKNRYLALTNFINGEVSPVSVVWNYLRQNYPNLDLYQADESHPSAAGSYAAACCFYTSIFKKDPTLITFNSGLSTSDASTIKNAVKTKVFNNLQQWDYKKLPVANIQFQMGTGNNEVIFQAINLGVQQSYSWNFGDGGTSTTPYISHTYSANGTYTVTLTTSNCDPLGMHTSFKDTVIQLCSHTPTISAPHSWLCNYDTLWTQAADSYQWYVSGSPLPETNQYLANYSQYNISGFSVVSTLNGCSELSKVFTQTPEWSGYYFDALGDPCAGDTVSFAVLHSNGFLSGMENILWFKNNVLLSFMTNEDTLFINSSGKYECKVINPGSNCPLDTSSYFIEFDCGDLETGVEERSRKLSWNIFPNPSSENITIKFMSYPNKEVVQIYNAVGSLIRTADVCGEMTLDISDLPKGFYYIRKKNNQQAALKFIKR